MEVGFCLAYGLVLAYVVVGIAFLAVNLWGGMMKIYGSVLYTEADNGIARDIKSEYCIERYLLWTVLLVISAAFLRGITNSDAYIYFASLMLAVFGILYLLVFCKLS